eukprot:5109077-Amphidinium_carterae.1
MTQRISRSAASSLNLRPSSAQRQCCTPSQTPLPGMEGAAPSRSEPELRCWNGFPVNLSSPHEQLRDFNRGAHMFLDTLARSLGHGPEMSCRVGLACSVPFE